MNKEIAEKLELLERRHFWQSCANAVVSVVCIDLALALFDSQYVLNPDSVAAGLLGAGISLLLLLIKEWRGSKELRFARELVQRLSEKGGFVIAP